MSNAKIERIRSSSSGVVGRAHSVARGQRFVLDSSTHPRPDALTSSEAFLSGEPPSASGAPPTITARC